MTESEPKEVKTCKTEGCLNEAKPNGYCQSCFSKKGGQAFARKKAAERTAGKASGTARADPQGTKAASESDKVIAVDFEGFEEILDQVRDLAREQVRPLNHEIIWLIKQGIKRGRPEDART